MNYYHFPPEINHIKRRSPAHTEDLHCYQNNLKPKNPKPIQGTLA